MSGGPGHVGFHSPAEASSIFCVSQHQNKERGSTLLTSLTYYALVTRCYEPWRPDADMGVSKGV